MKIADNTELLEAMLLGTPPVFHPNTGEKIPESGELTITLSPSARAGLEAPRYCQICGRRIVVQVRPDGWDASCSRHGSVDSKYLER
ncbi:biotin synthase auxiliary protein BsaP [Corynebacterium sp. H130]|uniref:biotin synthase auxiliary protein BsaP n=1 Tax=Corynebacterium sp. H130 TaxID=3133444 RepID=UPI0030A310BA